MDKRVGFRDDKANENCGVFGVFAPGENVARLAFFGLLCLQHRGQESAGIATSNFKEIYCHRGMGLVNQVFTEKEIKKLKGGIAVGHNRYSTRGSSVLKNAQPIVLDSNFGKFAMAHNGNLANCDELRRELLEKGHCFNTILDSEVIARLVAEAKGRSLKEKVVNGIPKLEGAFSLIFLSKDRLIVVRDQWGIRPLVLGKINSSGWLVASESVAIESVGGRVVREVKPGEFIEISKKGINTFERIKSRKKGFCIFEYVYFSRPDSVINGRLVHLARVEAGKILARKAPVKADYVISVPDSGTSAALGFSQESEIPFQEGLIKSRYVGRTFIQPAQRTRDLGVRMKFSPLKKVLEKKEIVLVDDSIVRGTTVRQIIKMLKKAGVGKVHVRVVSPPFKNICYLGVDVSRYEELIANKNKVEEIREKLGADSLAYLSLEGLKKAVGKGISFCTGCFDGNYPVKKVKKIAVLISDKGKGSNLQVLINWCKKGKIEGRIEVVVSDKKNAYGLVRARKNKISTLVRPFNKFKNKEARSEYGRRLGEELKRDYGVDLVVLAGWMIILPDSFLKFFDDKVINLHPGLIADKKRGKLKLSDGSIAYSFEGEMAEGAIEKAFKKGISISGSTVHFVREEVDWGPVIMRAEEKIKKGDSIDSYYLRLKKKEHLILPLSVKLFCEGKLKIKGGLVEILDKRYRKDRK